MQNFKKMITIVMLLCLPLLVRTASASLVITEIMSSSNHSAPVDCDWWEMTNTGPDPVDLQGYSWDDDHQRPGQNVFGQLIVDANESIIIRDTIAGTDDVWRMTWSLGPDIKVYAPGSFSRLGNSDGIFLYDDTGTLVTSITYGDSTTGFSLAWDSTGAALGTSSVGQWGAWQSTNSTPDVASPGYAYVPSTLTQPLATLLYWTDKDTAKIQRLNLETYDTETLLTSADGLREPRGLALDLSREKMFWTDGLTGTIHQSNLDGTDDQILVSGQSFPTDLGLDLTHGKMIWSETGRSRIQCANLDGSEQKTLIADAGQCYYLELDLVNGQIYWSQLGPQSAGTLIYRANLDGSDVEPLISGTGYTRDIVLDLSAGKLYWGDRSIDNPGLFRANLDGTDIEQLYDGTQGLIRPHGLLLDTDAGLLYWSDTRTYGIHRAPMDGSGPIENIAMNLDAPWRLTFLKITPDFNQDGQINFMDFATFGSSWRQCSCHWDNLWCHRTDLTGNGTTDFNDLQHFSDRWLSYP